MVWAAGNLRQQGYEEPCTLPQEQSMSASSSESVKPAMVAHLFMSTNPAMEMAASCAAMAAVGRFTTLQHVQHLSKIPSVMIQPDSDYVMRQADGPCVNVSGCDAQRDVLPAAQGRHHHLQTPWSVSARTCQCWPQLPSRQQWCRRCCCSIWH